MFCAGCGLEERHSNQFCRACGTDLRHIRIALERADNITESAATARDEIGRAIAAKILEAKSAKELAIVTDDVLPQIEKFLESPEEKRLRRIRVGTLIASIGFGAAITFSAIATLVDQELAVVAALGVITFLIGLSFIINGLLFTVPKKSLSDKSSDAQSQRELDVGEAQTGELASPAAQNLFSSVTEHTTQHLKEKQPLPRN